MIGIGINTAACGICLGCYVDGGLIRAEGVGALLNPKPLNRGPGGGGGDCTTYLRIAWGWRCLAMVWSCEL